MTRWTEYSYAIHLTVSLAIILPVTMFANGSYFVQIYALSLGSPRTVLPVSPRSQ